jgi:hypothetical protein
MLAAVGCLVKFPYCVQKNCSSFYFQMKKIYTRNFLDQQNLLTFQMKKSSQIFTINFLDQEIESNV